MAIGPSRHITNIPEKYYKMFDCDMINRSLIMNVNSVNKSGMNMERKTIFLSLYYHITLISLLTE